MLKAFISHSSPDDRYVQEMVQYLRTLGYDDVFNESHSIAPMSFSGTGSRTGIRECDDFVVILSHASVKSYWVDREVQFARELRKKPDRSPSGDCRPTTGGAARRGRVG